MMGIYQANSLTIREQDKLKGRELGTGVFPLTSRINHSCSPNSLWSFTGGGQCEVRCVRPVRAGEEITASYLPSPLLSRADRQRHLAARYNFSCTCQVCAAPPQAQWRPLIGPDPSRYCALICWIIMLLRWLSYAIKTQLKAPKWPKGGFHAGK